MVSDARRAYALFSALCPRSPEFGFIVIEGAPPSKARHRFGRGRTYKTAKDTTNEEWTALHLKKLAATPVSGNVAIGCVFFRPNRQRIDADNMLKHVLDAANGILVRDDCQVTAVMGVVEHDAARPRTIVVIGSHTSTMIRRDRSNRVCERCETSFAPKTEAARYCSQACAAKARGKDLSEPVACAFCEIEFRRRNSYQRFCSQTCANQASRGLAKGAGGPVCIDCGKPVSKTAYKRCRSCWKTARATHGVKVA